MKINFTVFNNGQEHYIFDTDTLLKDKGEELYKFLINRDEDGIYIVPMINRGNVMLYASEVLQRVEGI